MIMTMVTMMVTSTKGVLNSHDITLLTSFNNENADFNFFSKHTNARKFRPITLIQY